MKEELVKQLQEKYPKILENLYGEPNVTCMAFGIECGDGWYNLLDKMMSTLQWNADKNGYPQVIADQIKEKFGGLRFYYHLTGEGNERKAGSHEGVIDFAESLSYYICEFCGTNQNIGKTSGWVITCCESCHQKECSDKSWKKN